MMENKFDAIVTDIKVSELYQHFKGNTYKVICVAKHSETLEPLVVYKAMYDVDNKYWVRPLSMWNELVKVDGKEVPRFKHIGKDNSENDD